MKRGLSRRGLLGAGIAAGMAPLATGATEIKGDMPWQPGTADIPAPVDRQKAYIYLSESEAAFVEAASARIIPKDELGGGAIEANVPFFIDRQLAGEFGQATRWYMQGPWSEGESTQGYQSRLTPAQLYRAAIRDIDALTGRKQAGARFSTLEPEEQDSVLRRLESGDAKLDTVDAKAFFSLFLQNVMEGFFSDPVHGGNRDMIGWRLIGFPGARYDQRDFVAQHGKPYPLPPVGISGRPGWSVKGNANG